jgi:hypothetical protein
MIFAVGKRLNGVFTGVGAAVIYSFSYIIFRYHVFEREILLGLPVLAASWLAIDLAENKYPGRKSW